MKMIADQKDKKEAAAPATKSYRVKVKEGFKIPGTKIMVEEGDEMIVSGPVQYAQPDEQDAVQAFVTAACAKGEMRDDIVRDLVASFGLTQTDAELAVEKNALGEETEPEEPGETEPEEPSETEPEEPVEDEEPEEIEDAAPAFPGAAPPFEKGNKAGKK